MTGRVQFTIGRARAVAVLDESGSWSSAEAPAVARVLNALLAHRPGDAGPARGDVLAADVGQAARLLRGTCELDPGPAPVRW